MSQNETVIDQFNDFVDKYNKSYNTDDEYNAAFENFAKTLLEIQAQKVKFDANETKFLLGLNYRSDQSIEQKKTWVGLLAEEEMPSLSPRATDLSTSLPNIQNNIPAPKELDYRKLGYVTDVLDQGYVCSSCYSFATLCAVEGQFMKNNISTKVLSTQSIVDCSSSYGNYGCKGGYIERSFRYLIDLKGVQDFNSYPYEDAVGQCRYNDKKSVGSIRCYDKVVTDEETLKQVLSNVGPLAIGIKSDCSTFYNYQTGIYDDKSCIGKIDHAVCLVGYGTDFSFSPPVDYWLIKNSWSSDWGEKGYIRIKRGVNMCSIKAYIFYGQI